MYALTRRLAAPVLLLTATVVAQPHSSSWDTVKALAAGTAVRVTDDSRTVNGTIEGVTDGAIVVTLETGQESFKQQDVTRVSLKKNGHRRRNALIGLGVGAGVGLVVGGVADASCTSFCIAGNFGKAIFTPMGAIAGGLVGALLPSGGWREIYKK